MHDDRRKAAASGAAPRTHNGDEVQGKGYREGARQEQERKRGGHDEAKRFGVA